MAEVLARLQAAGLSCTGARVWNGDGVELIVDHAGGSQIIAEAVARQWPHRTASTIVERFHDGARVRVEIQPGVCLRWQRTTAQPRQTAPPRREPPPPDNRMLAYEVGRSDGGDDLDVVLAGSPDEAARCFLEGWGVPDGAMLAVRWDDHPGAIDPSLDRPLPHLRVFRVVHGTVVRVPGWGG